MATKNGIPVRDIAAGNLRKMAAASKARDKTVKESLLNAITKPSTGPMSQSSKAIQTRARAERELAEDAGKVRRRY